MRRNFFKGVSGYPLLTTFDTAVDQTFTDGQLLDTVAEGVLYGVLTADIDTPLAGTSILNGLLSLQGSDITYTTKGSVFSQAIAPIDGLAAYLTMGPFFPLSQSSEYYNRSGLASTPGISAFGDLLMPIILNPNGTALTSGGVPFPNWTEGVQDGYLCLIDKTNNEGFYFYFNGVDFDLIHSIAVAWPASIYMTVNDICNPSIYPNNKTDVGKIDIPPTLYTAQLAAAIGGQTTGFTFEGIE